jgi:hypothetical protein
MNTMNISRIFDCRFGVGIARDNVHEEMQKSHAAKCIGKEDRWW